MSPYQKMVPRLLIAVRRCQVSAVPLCESTRAIYDAEALIKDLES